jgi:hypothetical protein
LKKVNVEAGPVFAASVYVSPIFFNCLAAELPLRRFSWIILLWNGRIFSPPLTTPPIKLITSFFGIREIPHR